MVLGRNVFPNRDNSMGVWRHRVKIGLLKIEPGDAIRPNPGDGLEA
jgi:hypothetical protein